MPKVAVVREDSRTRDSTTTERDAWDLDALVRRHAVPGGATPNMSAIVTTALLTAPMHLHVMEVLAHRNAQGQDYTATPTQCVKPES